MAYHQNSCHRHDRVPDKISDGLKCIQRKVDIAGNCTVTEASSLCHIYEEKQVNVSYAACHEKH